MKKLTIITITSLIVLIGCMAVKPVKFKGPNGRNAYSMFCSYGGRTLDECYVKAGEACPNGYDVIDQRSTATGQGPPQDTLAIECKDWKIKNTLEKRT